MLRRLSSWPIGCLFVSLGACSSSSEAILEKRSSEGEAEEEEEAASSEVMGSGCGTDDLCLVPLKALEAWNWAESDCRLCEGPADAELVLELEVEASEERVALSSNCMYWERIA
jgi:hypothetical protein